MDNNRYLKGFRDAAARGLTPQQCIQAGVTADSLPTKDAFTKAMAAAIKLGLSADQAIQAALKQ